jgi:hypothetical protein
VDQLRRVGRFIGPSIMLDGLTAVILGFVFADRWDWAVLAGILVAIVLVPVGVFCWAVAAGSVVSSAAFIAGGVVLALLGLVGVFWGSVVGPRWLMATIVVSLVGAGLVVAGRERE